MKGCVACFAPPEQVCFFLQCCLFTPLLCASTPPAPPPRAAPPTHTWSLNHSVLQCTLQSPVLVIILESRSELVILLLKTPRRLLMPSGWNPNCWVWSTPRSGTMYTCSHWATFCSQSCPAAPLPRPHPVPYTRCSSCLEQPAPASDMPPSPSGPHYILLLLGPFLDLPFHLHYRMDCHQVGQAILWLPCHSTVYSICILISFCLQDLLGSKFHDQKNW